MKSIILSALLFFGSSAFGFVFDNDHPSFAFHGHGKWKSPAGDFGTYRTHLAVQHTGKGKATVTETFKFSDGKKVTKTLQLVRTSKNFFDVFEGEAKVAEGYCFKQLVHHAKVCHVQSTVEGKSSEATMHFDFLHHKIHRMGSLLHDETKIIWTDHLHCTHHHKRR